MDHAKIKEIMSRDITEEEKSTILRKIINTQERWDVRGINEELQRMRLGDLIVNILPKETAPRPIIATNDDRSIVQKFLNFFRN